MQLYTIETGNFKLDGGAMFGVVPKTIWQKLNPADENNLCNWAMRCLLIEDGNQLILVDNGIGNKQDAKFFSHYYLNGEASLEKSLAKAGFHKDDITDVFLTHLHFDHCGGSIEIKNNQLVTAFKNATYWSNAAHWQWATQPNAREKASFLKENILPIQESGQLQFIEPGKINEPIQAPFNSNIQIIFADGHTDKMMLPKIQYKGYTVVFMADLLPSVAHIPLPYVMAYDMFPLTTLHEKEFFLEEAVAEKYVLFFEHDIQNECCTVTHTEKGIRSQEYFALNNLV
ncbi:MAG: MBL fold metallo-hydrolase [Bacteroidota bacterium]|jgi:glyoxylase-like metal-dependent hydrolase (beta-lactamase superfamily II)|nr:MBL fold metallo-hydrolase [Bacteroidota bacterium]